MSKMRFPGSQARFESALKTFDKTKSYSTPELEKKFADLTDSDLQRYGMSVEERDYIVERMNNYVPRAVENGTLYSRGRRNGYSFEPPITTSGDKGSKATKTDGQDKSPHESLFHLPATFCLMDFFKNRGNGWAFSLKRVEIDTAKFVNPDMIIIMDSPLERQRSQIEEAWEKSRAESKAASLPEKLPENIFGLFGLSDPPPLSIASIELKVFRTETFNAGVLYSAITETHANSGWANESWLVFCHLDALAGKVEITEDLRNFASDLGVGILGIFIESETDGSGEKYFATTTYCEAETRSVIKTPAQRTSKFLRVLNEKIGKYQTVMDDIGTPRGLSCAITQSIKNLLLQDGFNKNETLDTIKKLKTETSAWDEILKTLYATSPGIVLDTWQIPHKDQYEKIRRILQGDEAAGISEAAESLSLFELWSNIGDESLAQPAVDKSFGKTG